MGDDANKYRGLSPIRDSIPIRFIRFDLRSIPWSVPDLLKDNHMSKEKSIAMHKLLAAIIGFFSAISILSGIAALFVIAAAPDEVRQIYLSRGGLEIMAPLQFIIATLGVVASIALYKRKQWGKKLSIFVCSVVVAAVVIAELIDMVMRKFSPVEGLSLLLIVVVPLFFIIRALRRLNFAT